MPAKFYESLYDVTAPPPRRSAALKGSSTLRVPLKAPPTIAAGVEMPGAGGKQFFIRRPE